MALDEAIVTGTLKPDGTLELDEKPNIAPGRVTVVLRQDAERSGDDRQGPAQISDEEFERDLDELSAGLTLPTLPAAFSRADIYADHD
jgi:hypothetical protein